MSQVLYYLVTVENTSYSESFGLTSIFDGKYHKICYQFFQWLYIEVTAGMVDKKYLIVLDNTSKNAGHKLRKNTVSN